MADMTDLDKADLSSLEEIFAAALDRSDPEARAAFLSEACGPDAELRARLERMLAAHDQAGSFLESPAPGLGATAVLRDAPAAESTGESVGPYVLLQKLGEGGMGTVWAAEQRAPVRRRVALKLIKPGMDSQQVLRRFEAERQALALMDHPNIAKVFDAGATESGRPYFAMELVKGVPITKYCDELGLTVRQRLELFIPVCRAIQHAHTKGVVHRDVKPSNVLVAVEDGRPVPKVIDFGVAKALHRRLADRTVYTEIGGVVGTLEYMAPEQAELSALDVDTRADVYALGALLYELLTGSPPLDKTRLAAAGLAEVVRIIKEEEPQRPSTRLSESAETLPGLAAQRRTEPSRLAREVRGDLDWVVMKCLEKDRSRRYETANALARDVERHLADEPVEARPPGRGYRLRKFARRNRGPLAAAALVLLTLVAGAAVATWQAVRATKAEGLAERRYEKEREARKDADAARKAADAAQRKAVSEAHKSEQVAAFMKRMLAAVGPSAALGRDTTMLREILDDTTRRLEQLKGQPAVEADLRTVLGGVYYDLGDYKAAEAMYRGALDLRRGLLGERQAEVASVLSDLGEAVRKQGHYDEAERLLVKAIGLQRELLGEDDPAVGLTLHRLGMVHNRRSLDRKSTDDASRAEAVLREALAVYRRHPTEDTAGGRGTASVLDQLALSLQYQRRHAEAESVFREALALQRRLAPSGSPALAHVLHNLGGPLRDQGKLAEAEACYRESLEIRRKQLPPGHRDTLDSIFSFANFLIRSGRAEEAAPLVEEFVRLAEGEAALQKQIPWLTDGFLRHFQKAGDAAGCRTAAELWEGRKLSDAAFYVDAARYRAVTAAVLRSTDRSPGTAENVDAEARRAMDWLREAVAAGYADVVRLKQSPDLAVLRDREDFTSLVAGLEPKPEEALASAREAVRLKPDDPQAHFDLGRVLSGQGKSEEAAAAFGEAVRLSPEWPEAYVSLAGVLRTQRKWVEARALDLRRLDVQLRLANDAIAKRPEDANAYRDRGVFLCRAGHLQEALPDLDKAIELNPDDDWNYTVAAPVHLYLGDVEGYRRVCRAMANRFGDTDVPEVLERLAKLPLLEPDPNADLELCARLVGRAVAQGESHPMIDWFKVTQGLVEYRRGRYDEAARALEGQPESSRTSNYGRGHAGLLLAMAEAKLGHADRAIEALDKAEAGFNALNAKPGVGDLGSFNDWCIYQVILREARNEFAGVLSERQRAALSVKEVVAQSDEAGKAGRWADAAALLEGSIENAAGVSPTEEYFQWYRAAGAWALAGDRTAYDRLCRRMLDRYSASSDMQAAQLAARVSLLLPGAPLYKDEAVRLAERSVDAAGGRAAPAYNLLTRSLAEYRAGRYEQAVEWNDAALARGDMPASRKAAHHFVQALALSQLGRATEARSALEEGLKLAPTGVPAIAGDPDWYLLRREAVAGMPVMAPRP